MSNGGYLDEVHFMANTANEKDLEYLDFLLTTSEFYKKIESRKLNMFDEMWAHATQPGTMYIKIDDDIVRRVYAQAFSKLIRL